MRSRAGSCYCGFREKCAGELEGFYPEPMGAIGSLRTSVALTLDRRPAPPEPVFLAAVVTGPGVRIARRAPAVQGGMFWRGATRMGAFAGLTAGFAIWLYTLYLPSFGVGTILPVSIVPNGLFGRSGERRGGKGGWGSCVAAGGAVEMTQNHESKA